MPLDSNKGEKIRIEYECKCCDYFTSDKTKYTRHCFTTKHKKVKDELQKIGINAVNNEIKGDNNLSQCSCGKVFKFRQGLYKHKKICLINNEKTTDQPHNTANLDNVLTIPFVIDLINQNKEFKDLLMLQSKQLMEQANQQSKTKDELINKLIEREPANSTINNMNSNNNTINNNQKFNLNFFLNETCKDAMSIQEFLENIRITFEDLLTIGNSGFVNGVSDILIKQLRDMEVNKRPIHCTDSKRDTIYLKENAAWNKDDKDKTKLKQIIEKIEYKNVVALRDWCNENPDARVNNTPNNILKDKIYFQTLQGDDKTRDKIIKNVSKEVMVEKD